MYLINVEDLDTEQRAHFRMKVHDALLKRAAHIAFPKNIDRVITRDLNPTDLGLATWKTPPLSPKQKLYWIDHHINNQTFIAIYKIICASVQPGAEALHIWLGGSRVAMCELGTCYAGLPSIESILNFFQDTTAQDVMNRIMDIEPPDRNLRLGCRTEAYLSEPIIIDSDMSIRCEIKSHTDSDGDYIILGGFAAEPRGLSIA